MSESLINHSPLLDTRSNRRGKFKPESYLTKREFLKFCGASLCALSASHLFGFPKTSQAQLAKKGLIRTKLSPYFTPLEGGEIQCELCPRQILFLTK